MISFPNAKINIGLRVLEKRHDGYHNIETLFCPVTLFDILEFVPAGENSDMPAEIMVTGDIDTGDPRRNLCVRAYDLLKNDYSLPHIKIQLHKKIPAGAGLGGGSSDAAFMLRTINKYFRLNISNERLRAYASVIGSDCAFFIGDKTALGYGRGEKLVPFDDFPSPMPVVIVNPGIHVSTAEAYSGIVPNGARQPLADLLKLPVAEWKNRITNDFEPFVSGRYPVIKEIKEELYRRGAVYASMTGSGSSVYGIFEEPPDVRDLFSGLFCHTGWLGSLP